MKVLFLGSHCDDIELGCGGTISKYKDQWDIHCCIFSKHGPKNKFKNLHKLSTKAIKLLGVKNKIIFFNYKPVFFYKQTEEIWEQIFNINEKLKPNYIFTQESDEQQDHEVLFNETIRNFKNSNVITYRSSSRNCLSFIPNYWEILNIEKVTTKLNALKIYQSVYSNKIYVQHENVKSRLDYDGTYINAKYAEGYRIMKIIK